MVSTPFDASHSRMLTTSNEDDEFVAEVTPQGRPRRVENIRGSKKDTVAKPAKPEKVMFQEKPGPKPEIRMPNSIFPVGAKDFTICAPPPNPDLQDSKTAGMSSATEAHRLPAADLVHGFRPGETQS